ncbi:Uncharacterised protein [Mycobacterium tuberculosis]|uniref:Uncharacterized protein n=2 Tax=Mycobacterium tuberculosis TaxID=1773 RepID=A0A654ZYA6_MYCTX|nr:Uncharacterised protein [Mycobacterium tuberculosis]COW28914.1 Uncharacterised protein [Mycobacterium tuberculosis]
MFWYGEYSEMNFQSSGLSGSPYSAIQEAPASSRWYRFMSSSGTSQTSAPNFSGYPVNMMPISSPPLLPPRAPSCSAVVMPRVTKSVATAAKSWATLSRPSRIACVCQPGPYSPPPRMLANA